ncbi:MAG: AarF/ABC1/UbiB kinase family protein [Nitrospirota bacterium]
MTVRRRHIGMADLNRLRKILVAVCEAGGGLLVNRLRLRYWVPLWCRIHCAFKRGAPETCLVQMQAGRPVVSASDLRELLERLGPTFIKLGQVLSMRADLVGASLSQELSKLQSDATPFSYEDARRIVKAELGKFPEELFKSFDERPVAAASLAQVHRAFLPNGMEVAVKIQRPAIRRLIEQDIHILYYLADLAERRMPELALYHPTQVIKEFADWTLRELDFSAEGHNAERFRAMFRDNPKIHIPAIVWELTTPRVLTMEFSHGVKVNEVGKIRAMGVDTRRLAEVGVEALFHQFFIAGFFHADPHPGNFFALPGGVLCLHDFGMVGYLEQAARRELLGCVAAFVNKDIDGYTKHLLHLAVTDEQSDVTGFKKDVAAILSEFLFSDHPPSVAWAFFRVMNRGAQNGVRFPADLALFGKAIVTTEGMGRTLYPDFDLNQELKPFVAKAMADYFSPANALQSLKTDVLDYVGALKALPERLQNVLTKLERGEIGIKLDTEDLQGIKCEFDRQNDLRILGIVLTAVLLATFGLLHLEGKTTFLGLPLSTFGILLSAVLLVWFLLRLKKGPGS